ncbi:hypothetical protein [Acetobacter orientalis]|uniref:hypothetical protein n=1 Tax=Acetobacter orientalis TaxID=146474 RepID=UPI00248F3AF3|nr:hypothetical protein [Acetobacter orientalis]
MKKASSAKNKKHFPNKKWAISKKIGSRVVVFDENYIVKKENFFSHIFNRPSQQLCSSVCPAALMVGWGAVVLLGGSAYAQSTGCDSAVVSASGKIITAAGGKGCVITNNSALAATNANVISSKDSGSVTIGNSTSQTTLSGFNAVGGAGSGGGAGLGGAFFCRSRHQSYSK